MHIFIPYILGWSENFFFLLSLRVKFVDYKKRKFLEKNLTYRGLLLKLSFELKFLFRKNFLISFLEAVEGSLSGQLKVINLKK